MAPRLLLVFSTACAWSIAPHARHPRAGPLSSTVVEDPPLFIDVRAAARDGPSSSRRSARLPTSGAVRAAPPDPKDGIQREATDAIIDAFADGQRRATAVLPGGAGTHHVVV